MRIGKNVPFLASSVGVFAMKAPNEQGGPSNRDPTTEQEYWVPVSNRKKGTEGQERHCDVEHAHLEPDEPRNGSHLVAHESPPEGTA